MLPRDQSAFAPGFGGTSRGNYRRSLFDGHGAAEAFERTLGEVCHYIHLNPVRAGVVTAARIRDYRWSSLHWFPQRSDRPG